MRARPQRLVPGRGWLHQLLPAVWAASHPSGRTTPAAAPILTGARGQKHCSFLLSLYPLPNGRGPVARERDRVRARPFRRSLLSLLSCGRGPHPCPSPVGEGVVGEARYWAERRGRPPPPAPPAP